VHLELSGGVVTLRGEAPSSTAAQAIADLLLAHDGVESVVNLIAVGRAPVGQPQRHV
jgi:osmotically-inducible protein OsmY